MFKKLSTLAVISSALLFSSAAYAEEAGSSEAEPKNHVSFFAGDTIVPKDENANGFTLGLDYERRVTDLIGVGVLAEHAMGEVDATSVFGTLNFHIWRGFVLQTGGGIEVANDGETNGVGRVGMIYEIELGNGFTVAPESHMDFSKDNSLVFGLSVGKSF